MIKNIIKPISIFWVSILPFFFIGCENKQSKDYGECPELQTQDSNTFIIVKY